MSDSRNTTLQQITTRSQQSIVSLLLDIQPYQAPQQDFLNFLNHLECFYVTQNKGTTLYRRWINPFDKTDYVALSYTWAPSQYEDPDSHGYSIQSRDRGWYHKSPVRNRVFDRITKYMRSKGLKLLWIDRHSIPQPRCKQPNCGHRPCHKKKNGLQCMDWVYKQSKHPVALLGRPISSHRELTLLYTILKGMFVNRSDRTGQSQLPQGRLPKAAMDALELLFAITSDFWWQRAWTFQENYKGGREMVLLISHPPSLARQKRLRKIFGNVPGELCVNSRLFSEQATKLCLAFRSSERLTLKEQEMIESILSKAGRYTVLLDDSQTMSPKIIADVEERDVTNVWDRLAIVGNCCSYPVRMDIKELQQDGHDLNVSMLAMFLLNGEILDNRPSNGHTASNMTVSNFLKLQSFDKMSSPLELRSLTFNKGSRFIDVRFHQDGVVTSGHLWELGRIIQTRDFNDQLPWVERPKGDLELPEQQRLTRLSRELEKFGESTNLARCIAGYLEDDAIGNPQFQIGENYMLMMMVEVSKAIEDGKPLRLGYLDGSDECMAIFTWDGSRRPGFVFTSSRPMNPDAEGHKANDTDRHVSLEVERVNETRLRRGSPPHLYTKRWASGICFFVDCPRQEVVFPWPPALERIGS